MIKKGTKIAVLSLGHIGNLVKEIIPELPSSEQIGHFNMRFVKPLDKKQLHHIFSHYSHIITIEDGCKLGGFGSSIMNFANENNYLAKIDVLGIEDRFMEHGTIDQLHKLAGLDGESIKQHINKTLNEL